MDTIKSEEKLPHVIVSAFKENANQQDVEQAAVKITAMIDEWNVQGNMIWTGSFNDGKSAMSIIEASEADASTFFRIYNDVCKSFLDAYMYQWDAMPILSLLGQKQTISTPEAPTPEAPTPEAPTPEAPTPEAPTPEAPTPEAPTPEATTQ